MKKLFEPIEVSARPAPVPRLTVTNSRKTLSLPMRS
jgi:hypothetical protein